MKKRISLFLLSFILLIPVQINAYWLGFLPTDSEEKNGTQFIGNWCWPDCYFYDRNTTYQPGDVIEFTNSDGTKERVIALDNVSRHTAIPPHNIDLKGRRAGAAYRENDVWYTRVSRSEYVAHERYQAGDIVYDKNNLHVFVGDYRRQYGTRCSTPKNTTLLEVGAGENQTKQDF